ncbi:DNA gyrase inhibitor YacG [Roseomonas frigidaquae]|uniref:DNA gyrase inhibitor YacG n=1 Tax=Falsiroseomonas frigidaquae TaxID=487318 RepID=A0ABX1F3D5_9PROT|nr:DNA gyrase inhibitor YacG [Falsiroseomonas frigidaquae]NKE46786.1 DNA gyrase inhibitor YacG [Falsiroseomonas frigidaquae]
MKPQQEPPRRGRRCPICSRALTSPGARFCSDRCSNVDLGRWLNGDYAIPVRDDPDGETETES